MLLIPTSLSCSRISVQRKWLLLLLIAKSTNPGKKKPDGQKKFNPMLTRSSTPMGNRLTHLRKGKFGNCSKTILMMIMFIKNIKPIKEYLPSQDHLMSIHLMNILKGQGHINKVINLPHISESSTLPFISPILQKLKTSSILQTLCTLFSMNIYNFCIMRYSATAQI